MPQRVCIGCNINFSISPANIKKGGGKYCSQSCRYSFLRRNKIDPLAKAYLAGFIDGEGYVGLVRVNDPRTTTKRYHTARLDVANTKREVLDEFKNLYGGTVKEIIRKNKHHKTAYHWVLSNQKVFLLLEDVYPYLRLKKPQADVLFMLKRSIIDNRRNSLTTKVMEEREELKNKIHLLNKKGT